MPYTLAYKSSNNSYAVQNIITGKTHGWTTKENAEAQLRILNDLYKPKCLCVGGKKCPN